MRKLWNRLSLVLAMVIVGPAAWAGVAKVSFDPGRVQWDAQVEHDGAVLTVSLPSGEVVRREFGANETPAFELPSGARDGAYTYELRLVPLRKAELLESSVVSGAFLVQAGAIVVPGGKEPQVRKVTATDQVFNDDLIVRGSACVGTDCVNNESFGLDTIRLKESALRIKFEDTSSSPGFASNDWQLTANDSDSGGANKFSIEDITGAKVPFTITAGAATNSIFVDSTGRVGFRTATPALDLHVNTSDAPAIRLEQNNSGGLAAQTWDIAGDEAEFFVRDVTSGSRLPFRIRSGAPTSSIDISAAGNVGIGTASPSQRVEVELNQDANTIALIENTNTGTSANAAWRAQSDTTSMNLTAHGSGRTATRFGVTLGGRGEILHVGGSGIIIGTLEADDIILGTNNTNRFQINGSTGAATFSGNVTVNGTFSNPSSRALKESFEPMDPSTVLKKFALLPINEWTYKSDERKLRHVGPTVEDFQSAFGLGTEGQYIFPMDVQGVTMAAVQGLYQLVLEKDAQIVELQKRLDTELAQIKALITSPRSSAPPVARPCASDRP